MANNTNNLAHILAIKNKGSNEFARDVGLSTSGMSDIINGKVNPRPATKLKIASALNMKVEEIFGVASYDCAKSVNNNILQDVEVGYVTTQSSYAIRLYSNLVSHCDLEEQDYVIHCLNKLDLEKIDYKAKESITKDIIAFAMKDSSMQPIIRQDDILFIDTSIQEIEDSKVYVFEYDNTLYIKQLIKEKDNQLRATTFSSSKGILIENIEDVHIFGRVVFIIPSSPIIV